MSKRKLIYADDARRAILETEPKLAYCIERIKAVDAVEVIHAYWMYADELDESGDLQAYCSNCMAFDLHAPRKKNDVPYCWRCGAKMDGDGNEID